MAVFNADYDGKTPTAEKKKNIGKREKIRKKSRIRETKHLLTDTDSSTDTKKIQLITCGSLLYNLLILVV